MSKKIVRSRDIVFLEDQFVGDDDKVEKASCSVEIPARLDQLFLLLLCLLITGKRYRMIDLKITCYESQNFTADNKKTRFNS